MNIIFQEYQNKIPEWKDDLQYCAGTVRYRNFNAISCG